MKLLFKKIILMNIIILTLGLSGCIGDDIQSNDLSNTSINNSYLNLEITGKETVYPSMDLGMNVYFSLYGFNYSYICPLNVHPNIDLGPTDSLSVSMNSTSHSLFQIFCEYHTDLGSINPPDNNTKQLTLNYKGYNFTTLIPSYFPPVYTVQSAVCSKQESNVSCDVTTSRPNGESYSIASSSYFVTSCNGQVYDIIQNAVIKSDGHDIFNFTTQCDNIGNPIIYLKIDNTPTRITPTTNYESGNINMQYYFSFQSKTITATMQ
ncbi:MAG: hypothetical protein ACK5Z5_05995 [Neisseriaceae bacterium]